MTAGPPFLLCHDPHADEVCLARLEADGWHVFLRLDRVWAANLWCELDEHRTGAGRLPLLPEGAQG